jgi:hypothetical protein
MVNKELLIKVQGCLMQHMNSEYTHVHGTIPTIIPTCVHILRFGGKKILGGGVLAPGSICSRFLKYVLNKV